MGTVYTFPLAALAPDVRELVTRKRVIESFEGPFSGAESDFSSERKVLTIPDVPSGVLEAILDVLPGATLAEIRTLAARSGECGSRELYYSLLRKEKERIEAARRPAQQLAADEAAGERLGDTSDPQT
jgi:hypothetical protein